MNSKILCGLVVALGLTAAGSTLAGTPAAGQTQKPSTAVSVEKDVVFGKGGDTDLKLDIYRPPSGRSKQMATIHFHGGGFAGGTTPHQNCERHKAYGRGVYHQRYPSGDCSDRRSPRD